MRWHNRPSGDGARMAINGDLFKRRPAGRLFALLCAVASLCRPLPLVAQDAGGGRTPATEEVPSLSMPVDLGSPYRGPREELVRLVERLTGLTIAYSTRVVCPGEVRLAARATLRECLDAAFARFAPRYLTSPGKVVVASDEVRMRTITGYCRDQGSRETLIGAHVRDTLLGRATATNDYGYFSLRLPTGRVPLRASFVGYEPYAATLALANDTLVEVLLRPRRPLDPIEVQGEESDQQERAQTSMTSIPMSQIATYPTLLGESDVARVLQQTPGVASGGEGFGGMSVRGGGLDQNMVYLDDAPLYNANHMMGLFSVFNSDAVKKVRLLKGGFPARYGGHLSSVLDVRTLDGDLQRLAGAANIGLLSSSLVVGGPLAPGKASFIVSAKRTYFDLFSNLLQRHSEEVYNYLFYDLHAKLHWQMGPRDRLVATFFYSRDKITTEEPGVDIGVDYGGERRTYTLADRNATGWGTLLTSLRWNHALGSRVYATLAGWLSHYQFNNREESRRGTLRRHGEEYRSGILDAGGHLLMNIYPSNTRLGTWRAGLWVSSKTYKPLISVHNPLSADTLSTSTTGRHISMRRVELHAHVDDRLQLGPVFLTLGVHLSAMLGRGARNGARVEPRLLAACPFGRHFLLKVDYSLTTQFSFLMRMLSVSTPSDIWLPAPDGHHPPQSSQVAVEAQWRLPQHLRVSVEVYNKALPRLLTSRSLSPYEILNQSDWGASCLRGHGYARGFELFVHRRQGRLTGWVGYTLGEARNRFDEVNGGDYYAADNDRRHALQIFATWAATPRLDLSVSWNFATGVPLTLASQRYSVEGEQGSFMVPPTRNSLRMPSNHQLNIGATVRFEGEKQRSSLSVGVYNLYGRKNPLFVYWDTSRGADERPPTYSLKQFTLIAFPCPYIKYSLAF